MRQDPIPHRVVARNSVRILALGLATALISGGAGILISLLHDPGAQMQALMGWAFMGIILFGFPIIMALLLPREP
jgi:Na+/melibiose symporter-like transporter